MKDRGSEREDLEIEKWHFRGTKRRWEKEKELL